MWAPSPPGSGRVRRSIPHRPPHERRFRSGSPVHPEADGAVTQSYVPDNREFYERRQIAAGDDERGVAPSTRYSGGNSNMPGTPHFRF
ncbi:hypothetical protein E1285_13175 [Actinomadura sp. 7K507]|nr:hypothetical protein E1285_13175 [Actinomadura sp. 7K507]